LSAHPERFGKHGHRTRRLFPTGTFSLMEANQAANRLAKLSPLKLALLLERVKQRDDVAQIHVIPRQDDLNRFPLSYAQQRLWLLDKLEPGGMLFNMPAAWRLEGTLDVRALQAAFTEMCRRHEVLRTTFAVHEGQPVQVVEPAQSCPLPISDLTMLSQAMRRQEVSRIGAEWASLPFDLSRGPLLRARLLKLNEQHHALLLVLHHIIADGWSFGNIFRELSMLYSAYSQSAASPLPELEIQYGDYSVWQRERMQGQVFDQQLSYWKGQLNGLPAFTKLPTDRTRPAVPRRTGRPLRLNLSPELTNRIRALNQREGVTLFMSMLAAFQLLLGRYSGQEDICVGSPLAGRKHRQTESLIGFFINTLVLRTKLSGNPTFSELLARVRETYLGAYAHQDVPFEKLVAELQPDQRAGQSPFFQVWFALQNLRRETLKMAGLTLSPLDIGEKKAQFNLAMILWEEPEHIGCCLISDEDLFDADTAEQILKDYETLLQQVTAHPEQKIFDIPIDSPSREGLSEISTAQDAPGADEQFIF
jgi:hypothetical protein